MSETPLLPCYAVLAVDLADPGTGTVVSLHGTQASAEWARQGYRHFGPAHWQPDTYVIGPVPRDAQPGCRVALTAASKRQAAEDTRRHL